jgi:hypothetical protein
MLTTFQIDHLDKKIVYLLFSRLLQKHKKSWKRLPRQLLTSFAQKRSRDNTQSSKIVSTNVLGLMQYWIKAYNRVTSNRKTNSKVHENAKIMHCNTQRNISCILSPCNDLFTIYYQFNYYSRKLRPQRSV